MINDIVLILPLISLVVWATALLVIDLFIPRERKSVTAGLAALGLLVTLVMALTQTGTEAASF